MPRHCLIALLLTLPLAAAPVTALAAQEALSQERLDDFAGSLKLTYRVVTNRPGPHCEDEGACYSAELELVSPREFAFTGWEIYFSAIKAVQATSSAHFTIEHINGDLHRITPTQAFAGFEAGQPEVIAFTGDAWQVSEYDVMPNFYVAAEGLKPRVIDSTRTALADTGLEILPFVESFTRLEQFHGHSLDENVWATSEVLFERNSDVADAPGLGAAAIIPTPAEVSVAASGARLDLARGIAVDAAGVERAGLAAALARLAALGVPESAGGVPLHVALDPEREDGPESYGLTIGPESVGIEAADAAGASYALYSLASALAPDEPSVPQMIVRDRPRFAFRGQHMDLARNFPGKQVVLQVLDQMAAYKLNRLHLHLADDEGWRLEIPGLGELTGVGSRRCHDLDEDTCLLPQLGSGPDASAPGSGFLSRADYMEIVRAADARHIRVIPSIDTPAHSRAAIKSMEARYRRLKAAGQVEAAEEYLLSDPDDRTEYESIQYYRDNTINVCMDSTYRFLGKVVDEIAAMHAEAGQPLSAYHIGADETVGAWYASPRCQEFFESNDAGVTDAGQLTGYFVQRFASMLIERGLVVAGWSDGLGATDFEGASGTIQSNVWGTLGGGAHEAAHGQANRGWQVVLSTPDVMFLDFPYEADPKESGYYWGSRQTNTRKIFNFMPENLPANTEHSRTAFDTPISMDDRPTDSHSPLAEGVGFLGMQAQLWSECVRRPVMTQAMLFPRLLAFAERAWHRAPWEVPYRHEGALYDETTAALDAEARALRDRQWQAFANALGHRELARLDRLGIHYRVPTVGARVAGGELQANVIFPGLPIEYRMDGGAWRTYSGPVPVSGEVEVRARSADGMRVGRALRVGMTPSP